MHRARWDDLQYVHAVVEHGSLSAASRALGVNHATVLRRIALLEARHRIVLFDRSRDGYRLRPEGRVLLNALKMMERAAARIDRSLAVSGQGAAGTFRLATTDSIANILLPKCLKTLRETLPNVRIEVAVSNATMDVTRTTAEILIRPGHELHPALVGEKAAAVDFNVFGTAAYLAAHPGDQVEDHQWLGVPGGFAQSTAGDWQFSRIADMVDISADSFLTLASLAAQDLGLAILPAFIGRATEGLIRAEQFTGGPTTGIWVATHAEYQEQEQIKPLLDFFTEAIRSDPAMLA